jgi:hypothetical protein
MKIELPYSHLEMIFGTLALALIICGISALLLLAGKRIWNHFFNIRDTPKSGTLIIDGQKVKYDSFKSNTFTLSKDTKHKEE